MYSLESSSSSSLPPLSTSSHGVSAKQLELTEQFEHIVAQLGIKLYVNKPLPSNISEPVSIDVEHDEEGGFVGVGLYHASSNSHYWYCNWVPNYPDISALALVAHNGVSDIDMLQQWGWKVKYDNLVHDTMLFGHIIDSSLKSYGLKDMAKRDLSIEYPSYDDIVGKRTLKQSKERITLDKQPPRLVQLYNCMDCYATGKLREYQLGRLY